MSKIIEFYEGKIGNNEGYHFEEILKWRDVTLEMEHSYIQWLFPSDEPSNFNTSSPTLTEKDCEIFKKNKHLQEKVKKAFLRMLSFYEFELCEKDFEDFIVREIKPSKEVPNWLQEFNHNMLRITRILKSLRLLGLENYSLTFFSALSKYKDRVSSNTFEFWRSAALGCEFGEIESI